MHPRTWFGLAIRIIGVWTTVKCVPSFIYGFNVFKGFDNDRTISSLVLVNQGVGELVVGLLLLKLAPMIATWAYPIYASPVDDEDVVPEGEQEAPR